MNRKQRRALGKDYHNVVDMPETAMHQGRPMTTGTRFKIPGHKRMPDGTLIKNCKPGDETIFICNIVPGMKIKPTDREDV